MLKSFLCTRTRNKLEIKRIKIEVSAAEILKIEEKKQEHFLMRSF